MVPISNEPWRLQVLGYGRGTHVPHAAMRGRMRATHIVNLAQGKPSGHQGHSTRNQVGSASACPTCEPAASSEADRRGCDRCPQRSANVWFVHPALRGEYPKGFHCDNPLDIRASNPATLESLPRPARFSRNQTTTAASCSAVPPARGRNRRRESQFRRHEGPLTVFRLGSADDQRSRLPHLSEYKTTLCLKSRETFFLSRLPD